jgi:hypothetical protein
MSPRPAAGPAKLPGLVQAGSRLTFDPPAGGRRPWTATFEFDGGASIGGANAKIAYESGDPAITFGAVRAGTLTYARHHLLERHLSFCEVGSSSDAAASRTPSAPHFAWYCND